MTDVPNLDHLRQRAQREAALEAEINRALGSALRSPVEINEFPMTAIALAHDGKGGYQMFIGTIAGKRIDVPMDSQQWKNLVENVMRIIEQEESALRQAQDKGFEALHEEARPEQGSHE